LGIRVTSGNLNVPPANTSACFRPDLAYLRQQFPGPRRRGQNTGRGWAHREWHNVTLQPTELIHEAYLRLVDQNQQFNSRSHFYGVAAHLMRLILVDHARSRAAEKRGGGGAALPLSAIQIAVAERSTDLLALDEALSRLAEFDARKSRAVELRFFGGMSLDEIAEVLGISTPTVVRDLRAAQTWLHRELAAGGNTERTASEA